MNIDFSFNFKHFAGQRKDNAAAILMWNSLQFHVLI